MQRREIELLYEPGKSFDIAFGGPYGKDTHGIWLYGDVNHPDAGWSMEVAQAEVADKACLSDHQKILFWFRFEKIRPYGTVVKLYLQITTRLKEAGWQVASALEGYPDTGSSVDNLVDTDSPEYWGKPEANWPREPNAEGYNAAGGLSVVVEKPATEPEFTLDEIEMMQNLAKEFGQIAYGRQLEEVKIL